MSSLLTKWFRPATSPEKKSGGPAPFLALSRPAGPSWTQRDYLSLARAGVERNAVGYRCVRLIAEAAASANLKLAEGDDRSHPLARLLAQPNPEQTGPEFFEALYGYLQTAGNAYIEAVSIDGTPRALYALRPDRMRARVGADGWTEGWEYTIDGRRTVYRITPGQTPAILHIRLFHPSSDHYGLSPLEAAAGPVDFHNAALAWNKALLDNAARPSGALVYSGPEGAENLTAEQFERLKAELADAYSGAANAGRPLVLDGGLEWRAMSLSPADMDFQQARNAAAREIALAFGVPPMLLGIPGDNTYANYREANLAFWKQTVLPLVRKTAASLSGWLGATLGGAVVCDLASIEALEADRDAKFHRVAGATFLSDDEKRAALGFGPRQSNHQQEFRP